jgi:hypothetical protein
VIGLAAYLFLIWAALTVLFAGLRRTLARGSPWPGPAAVTRAALAAAYAGLLLHTLVYAAYLEDPLAWVLLAVAASLRAAPREPAEGAAAEAGTPGARLAAPA